MQPSEREQWVKVAEALGVKQKTPLAVGLIRVRAMFHGLACMEANGSVRMSESISGKWLWSFGGESPKLAYADSHPAALLAMLTAHREAKP